MSWSLKFDEPIELANGKALPTLRDAGHYVAGLPKATQSLPAWQLVAEMLLSAAERGGICHACRDCDAPRVERKAKRYRIIAPPPQSRMRLTFHR